MRWDDAHVRVQAFVKAQKTMKDSIEAATELERYIDGVPRSLLLWELTQLLPEQSKLDDIRLETRTRSLENAVQITERITLLGIAPDDASISSYIEGLSNSSYFTNVSLMYAQQDGDSSRRNFSMQLDVSPTATLIAEIEQ